MLWDIARNSRDAPPSTAQAFQQIADSKPTLRGANYFGQTFYYKQFSDTSVSTGEQCKVTIYLKRISEL
jgi:hypothetical protein